MVVLRHVGDRECPEVLVVLEGHLYHRYMTRHLSNNYRMSGVPMQREIA